MVEPEMMCNCLSVLLPGVRFIQQAATEARVSFHPKQSVTLSTAVCVKELDPNPEIKLLLIWCPVKPKDADAPFQLFLEPQLIWARVPKPVCTLA